MSWPHVLSFSRMAAGPLVSALVFRGSADAYLAAALVFAAASLTDLLDGKLARHSQRVNALGVFLDTTSDKVLVAFALVSMLSMHLVPAWMVLVILTREFIISGLRSFAAANHRVISAHKWGKGKVALTMTAIFALLAVAAGRSGNLLPGIVSATTWDSLNLAALWLMGTATLITVASGLRYLVDAWPLFHPARRLVEVPREEQGRVAAGRKG